MPNKVAALASAYPLEHVVAEMLHKHGHDSANEGAEQRAECSRELYLDAAETVVRAAASWQDGAGCVLDPYEGLESPTATARFVGAGAALAGAGRCLDLLPQIVRAFDWCLSMLLRHQYAVPPLQSADFFSKELAWGYGHLRAHISGLKQEEWTASLTTLTPEGTYTDLIRADKDYVDNWNMYALVGEFCRVKSGLCDPEEANAFVERYLRLQFPHFTSYGMYRDPQDPITYDLTVRQNLSLLLDAGYSGIYRDEIDELLRRGGLTTLLTVAPNGQAAFGGRSNQFHHMEGMIACIAEYEAKRYARSGDRLLAGAFKRLGRSAVSATMRWWREQPFKHLKNSFDPVTRHGQDRSGQYSVYGVLAANLYGVAYHMADESIGETTPLPAEIGGYAVHLPDAFHKVFATAGGYHVEIDSRADLHYDATGLGRLMKRGVPAEVGLSSPLCGTPAYFSAVPDAGRHAAIGPVWRREGDGNWMSLAGQSEAVAAFAMRPGDMSAARVEFETEWRGELNGCCRIEQRFALDSDGVTVICRLEAESPLQWGFLVPLLKSDGAVLSRIAHTNSQFMLRRQGYRYKVALCPDSAGNYTATLAPGPTAWLPERGANRNGVYVFGLFAGTAAATSAEIRLHFSLECDL